jgi:hypothetical protein
MHTIEDAEVEIARLQAENEIVVAELVRVVDRNVELSRQLGELNDKKENYSDTVIHVSWHCGVTLCGRPLEGKTLLSVKEHQKVTCEVCKCRAETYEGK